MTMTRGVIFANGEMRDAKVIKKLIRANDLLIAADGGLRHYNELQLVPKVLIGDLDSVPDEEIEKCKNAGVQIIRYSVKKDETDLQLALDFLIKKNIRTILIVAALGGRLDHTLGNLCLLQREDLVGREVILDDGIDRAFVIRDQIVIKGANGDKVSLIPLWGEVSAIRTEGLRYPLVNETLYSDQTRGISNELIASSAKVIVGAGRLLCIHTRK
jgi:thiamine pyrophosphokinase